MTDIAIPRAPFGRTGHSSSRVVFGAAALGAMRQERADQLLPLLLRYGVNHLDTAASYGDAELRMAPWLAAHRGEFFLATKTGERNGAAARAELERSLERMGVERVDLIQLHNLVEPDEWEAAFAPDGAVAALAAARDEGLVRFIGITGHGLRIAATHTRSLERFEFDSVLLPYSYVLMQLPEYRADVEALFATCEERDVAIQTIKSIARRRWAPEETRRHSWYEPLRDADAIRRAVHWVLADDRVFLNSTSDADLLPLMFDAAANVGARPSDATMEADVVAHGVVPIFDGAALERI